MHGNEFRVPMSLQVLMHACMSEDEVTVMANALCLFHYH